MNLKKVIFIILIALCAIAGFYVGFWIMFVGGFIDIVIAIKDPTMTATAAGINLAIGVIKILFSAVIGIITFLVCALITSFIMIIHSNRAFYHD